MNNNTEMLKSLMGRKFDVLELYSIYGQFEDVSFPEFRKRFTQITKSDDFDKKHELRILNRLGLNQKKMIDGYSRFYNVFEQSDIMDNLFSIHEYNTNLNGVISKRQSLFLTNYLRRNLKGTNYFKFEEDGNTRVNYIQLKAMAYAKPKDAIQIIESMIEYQKTNKPIQTDIVEKKTKEVKSKLKKSQTKQTLENKINSSLDSSSNQISGSSVTEYKPEIKKQEIKKVEKSFKESEVETPTIGIKVEEVIEFQESERLTNGYELEIKSKKSIENKPEVKVIEKKQEIKITEEVDETIDNELLEQKKELEQLKLEVETLRKHKLELESKDSLDSKINDIILDEDEVYTPSNKDYKWVKSILPDYFNNQNNQDEGQKRKKGQKPLSSKVISFICKNKDRLENWPKLLKGMYVNKKVIKRNIEIDFADEELESDNSKFNDVDIFDDDYDPSKSEVQGDEFAYQNVYVELIKQASMYKHLPTDDQKLLFVAHRSSITTEFEKKEIADSLYKMNLRYLLQKLKPFRNKSSELFLDLYQEMSVKLLKAIEKGVDISEHTTITTYLSKYIMGDAYQTQIILEKEQFGANRGNIEDFNKIDKEKRNFHKEHGRLPNDKELIELTNISLKIINELKGLESSAISSDGDDGDMKHTTLFQDDKPTPEEFVETRLTLKDLWPKIKERLDEKDLNILKLHLEGCGGTEIQKQLGFENRQVVDQRLEKMFPILEQFGKELLVKEKFETNKKRKEFLNKNN